MTRPLSLLLLGLVAAGCQDDDPDGWIYFAQQRGEQTSVQRVSAAGGPAQAIAPDLRGYPQSASPDGRTVALIDVHDEADDLVLARPDGTHARPLAASPGRDWYPRFSPDGRTVLFESSRASFRDLYVADVRTGAVRRLTDDPEGNFDAAWAPDGRRIAFASSRGGRGLHLFVMAADGGDPTQLTFHPGDAVKPAWSPDGRHIAYLSARDGRDNVLLIPAGGGVARNLTGALTEAGAEVVEFAWHPTEARLLVNVRRPLEGGQIFALDLDGAARRLSTPADRDAHPAWSPDGDHVAFDRTVEGVPNVWIVPADGGAATQLTHDREGAWLPRWLDVEDPERSS